MNLIPVKFIFDKGSLTVQHFLPIVPEVGSHISFMDKEIDTFLEEWSEETGCVPRVYIVEYTINDNGTIQAEIEITCEDFF